MKSHEIMSLVEKTNLRANPASFDIGDTVDVHLKIVEGEKERLQVFTGIVISKKGSGVNSSFTVRRLVGAEGVERVFPANCPSIDKIEVKKKGTVRLAKLYYLRDRVGKATRVAEKLGALAVASTDGAAPVEQAVKPRQKAEAASQAEGAKETKA